MVFSLRLGFCLWMMTGTELSLAALSWDQGSDVTAWHRGGPPQCWFCLLPASKPGCEVGNTCFLHFQMEKFAGPRSLAVTSETQAKIFRFLNFANLQLAMYMGW